MERFKRALSLVLCFVMVCGLMPMNVFAASGSVIDAAIFCSDVHGSSSAVSSAFSGIFNADSAFDPSTATFVGDTQMAASSVTSAAQSVYSDVACYYAYGNHDSEGNYGISDVTGLLYSGENYYIYAISQTSMASSNPDTSGFTSTVAGLDKSKPLFIASHLPLHSRRGDSNGAAAWYEAISAAAESMDIVFFWAHNHTGENEVDEAAFYVAKDGDETFTLENTSTVVTPNFTYMNAGFVGKSSSRGGVVTTVKIYSDAMVFQDYTSSGAFTGEYSHNVEVAREFASSTDSGDSDGTTEETTEPTEGETTTEEKEVYVLVDTMTVGKDYLIANGNSGTVTLLGQSSGSATTTTAEVKTSGDYTYIETADSGYIWNATAHTNSSYSSYPRLINAETYAMYASNSSLAFSSSLTSNSGAVYTRYWTYTDGQLACVSTNSGSTTYYLTYSDGYSMTSTATDGIYIYEKQTIEVSSDGSVSGGDSGEDDTTGGSTETVVGEGTYTTADDQSYQKVTFGSTTTEKKTVYVLTSSITSGTAYLIANSNSAGSAYVVANNSGEVDATGVTVVEDDTIGTYIELTDATDELWTTSGSSSTSLKNGSYYLTYSGSKGNYSLDLSTSSASWTYSSNRLSIVPNKTTYYVVYDSGWDMSSSSDNVYFYVPTEVEVTVGSSVTYSVSASDIEHFYTADTTDTETVTISASVTDGTPDGTYAYEVVGGDNIITSISDDGVITFNGTEGIAQVKVSYTWTEGENTYIIWQVIDVTTTSPYYTLDITKGDSVVSGTTISQKGVTSTTTVQLGTEITFVSEDGAEELDSLPEGATLTWTIPEEYQNIAAVDQNGLVSFKGVGGAFYVTATLSVNGKDYTTGVNISATTSQYSVPTDGVTDFPEYPNEGAIRYDKTATAVGNFSETGIAQVELSMTGVPYTEGSEIDVVLMLDMTGSMTTASMNAAEAAAKAFADQIIKNEDGSYNNNRISVQIFNKNGVTELWGMSAVTADTYESLVTAIGSASDKQASGGTPYSTALSGCKDILDAARTDGTGNDRQQFCVFVSDGTPTSYTDVDGGSDTTKKEYYSSQMQEDGVTVYGVYTSAAAGSSGSNGSGGSVNDVEEGTAIMQNVASSDDKVYVVEDYTNTSALTGVFTSIAMDILQAATDVTVEDQITDEYTMIFDIPTGSKEITGVTNDFYIEFGKYALNEDHERTDFTSVTKLYLQNTDGTLSAKDADAPVFEQKVIGDKGTLYYWSTNASDGDADISVTVDGTTYYFVSYGLEEAGYNMTSGAYASGNIDSTTNMSEDLVIATPYFVYNAATKMLYWTVDKLDTNEYVLRYFLYLDNSATEVATDLETDPGSYPTNDHAYITYTNFLGNDCRQVFPIPQLTWSGAQVSYVFYLVNAAGQPINKSGQVVDFANATFVTDIYTEHTVWNKGADGQITADSQLDIDWLAQELLPDDYMVYDEDASYKLHVFGSHTGESIFDYFTIGGSTAAEISASLNTRVEGAKTTADSVSVVTTKVYNTKAGQKITGYGTYTSEATNSIDNEIVLSNFDFYNTTVAFAVVWQPKLVPDVVVVDYGLDVLINVVQNDLMQNTVSGIGVGKDAYGNTAMNTGVSTESKLGTAALTIDGNTISLENENQIRFHQGDMEFSKEVLFYYESPVEFVEDSDAKDGYMYSSVTVIPATTIYYEDNFISYESYTWDTGKEAWGTFVPKDVNGDGVTDNSLWSVAGTTFSNVQAQDRPGESQISGSIDADNIYGYDGAYASMSAYSNGSAMKATVDYDNYASAKFTFYGTGFDVISLTSSATGTLAVIVKQGSTVVKSMIVDTYYGYTQESGDADGDGTVEDGEMIWVLKPNAANSIYQVPVMEVADLPYGKYEVEIQALYEPTFDHIEGSESYDLYLDAIRIYDPANDGKDNSVIENAYKADGEGWPSYIELRNKLIDPDNMKDTEDGSLDAGVVEGMVFIDGDPSVGDAQLSDYISYGPNNEVYLAPNQQVAFLLEAPANIIDRIHLGIKSADGNAATYTIANIARNANPETGVEIGERYAVKTATVNTTTDMYYDITGYKNDIIVISNTGSEGILSITNIKSTYKSDPNAAANNGIVTTGVEDELFETYIYMTADAAAAVMKAMEPKPVNPFADIQAGQFFYESVLWAVKNGITNGVDATHFGPYINCNRAQVVTFLWRAAGSPAPESRVNPFTDVPENGWYTDAVLWAVENGITNGLTATTFGPTAQCNRAQVVTFLWRANGSKQVSAANPFTDVAEGAFYRDAVIWALANGITTGATATEFNPTGICMRAHVVTFLYRAEQLADREVNGVS